MDEQWKELTLENLNGGGAIERVNEAIEQLRENFQDSNTDPEAKRSITLKIVFEGSEDRESAKITAKVDTKLAGPKPQSVIAHMGVKDSGEEVLVTYDPRQTDAFRAEKDSVLPIAGRPAEA